jgi:hypothetical protein
MGFRVRRYRLRIEGLFGRIERWQSLTDPSNVYWRSITPENVTSLFGGDSEFSCVRPSRSIPYFPVASQHEL